MADRHVVMFSGGIGSWATAKRVAAEYGTDNLVLLFADTKMEDADLYRFLDEAAGNIGAPLVRLVDGRDIWQVFKDERFLGNSRIDPCSKILKRKPMRQWIEQNRDPADTICYLGIDWTEIHRYENAQRYWKPWTVKAPMCEKPYLTKDEMREWLKREGIEPPRLYKMGFPHNNCGGGCVKAGQSQFKLLYEAMPDRYAEWEANEEKMREHLGRDVSILTTTKGGEKRPLTLRELREQIEAGDQIDLWDWGGCACFEPAPGADDACRV